MLPNHFLELSYNMEGPYLGDISGRFYLDAIVSKDVQSPLEGQASLGGENGRVNGVADNMQC